MIALGVPAAQAAGRTLFAELDAHFRAGDPAGAISRANAYRQEIPNLEAADYAYLLHYFNQKSTDPAYLYQAPTWAGEGFRRLDAGKPNPQIKASLYYELAIVLQKRGQRLQALENARKGLDVAQKGQIALTSYQQLVDSLQH
jgi:hypothetical protein